MASALGADDHACAICNRSSHSKSNLTHSQFWLNRDDHCRHYFCDKCYQREFGVKRQFSCGRCNRIVLKHKLVQKDADEIEVERDFTIRKKIKAIYNKMCEAFPNEDAFRDYEEMVEDIIHNLVNNVDVDATNKQVVAYQKENLQAIAENQSKQQVENELLKEDILRAEETKTQKHQEERAKDHAERIRKIEHAKHMNEIALGERDETSVFSSSSSSSAALAAAANRQKDEKKDEAKAPVSRLFAGAMGGLDTTAQSTAPSAPSHVLSVLNSRPEPKHTRLSDKKRCEAYSNDLNRAMDTAGGYEYITYTRRNWRAIAEEVDRIIATATAGQSMDVDDAARPLKCTWPLNWE